MTTVGCFPNKNAVLWRQEKVQLLFRCAQKEKLMVFAFSTHVLSIFFLFHGSYSPNLFDTVFLVQAKRKSLDRVDICVDILSHTIFYTCSNMFLLCDIGWVAKTFCVFASFYWNSFGRIAGEFNEITVVSIHFGMLYSKAEWSPWHFSFMKMDLKHTFIIKIF